jgi:hypothetical protein
VTFTASICAMTALVTLSTRAKPPVMPALLTSARTGPSVRSAVSKRFRISVSLETSPRMAMALAPSAVSWSTTRDAAASPVAKFTATSYPAIASALAVAAPIPRLAPVTIAVSLIGIYPG